MTATLRDLAHRLAEATGPDRELDARLHCCVRLGASFAGYNPADDAFGHGVQGAWLYVSEFPHYTADLNACAELMRAVLPGYAVRLIIGGASNAAVWPIGQRFAYDDEMGNGAPTAPLAWLKAMVAAVMAREGGG